MIKKLEHLSCMLQVWSRHMVETDNSRFQKNDWFESTNGKDQITNFNAEWY